MDGAQFVEQLGDVQGYFMQRAGSAAAGLTSAARVPRGPPASEQVPNVDYESAARVLRLPTAMWVRCGSRSSGGLQILRSILAVVMARVLA